MIFEICAIVATILLAILTVYIVITLQDVQKTLKNANKSIVDLKLEAAVLRMDLNKFMESSTELVQNLNGKVSDLAPLFETVHHAGNALNSKIHAFQEKPLRFTEKVRFAEAEEEEGKAGVSDSVLDVIDLAKIGIKLYQQIKKRK